MRLPFCFVLLTLACSGLTGPEWPSARTFEGVWSLVGTVTKDCPGWLSLQPRPQGIEVTGTGSIEESEQCPASIWQTSGGLAKDGTVTLVMLVRPCEIDKLLRVNLWGKVVEGDMSVQGRYEVVCPSGPVEQSIFFEGSEQ